METTLAFIISWFFIILMVMSLISAIIPIGISFLPTRKISLLFLTTTFLLYTLITVVFFSNSDGTNSKVASAIIFLPLIVALAYFTRRSLVNHYQHSENNKGKRDLIINTQSASNEPNSLALYEEELYVAGTYYKENDALDFLSCDEKYIRTLPEPNNPYDRNAIKVIGYGTQGNDEYSFHIGYLPREYAQALNKAGVQSQIFTKLNDLNFEPSRFDDEIEIVIQLYGPTDALDSYNKHLKQAFIDITNKKRRELNS